MDAFFDLGLLGLVLTATVTDVLYRRVPNLLILVSAIIALGLAIDSAGLPGVIHAISGFIAGLALLLPLYALSVLGAGDVKLAAAIGAYSGATGLIQILLASAMAGGILALLYAARDRRLSQLLTNLGHALFGAWITAAHGTSSAIHTESSIGSMPYAPCLAIGCLVWRFKMQNA